MIRGVLFDLDGTLLDTLDDMADSANHVLSAMGFPTHPNEEYRYFVGDGVDVLIDRILPADRRTPELHAQFKAQYLPYYNAHALDKTRPYDGVFDMLHALRARGLKTAVVSNKPDLHTNYTIEHLFPPDLFDYVAGNIEGTPLKPDPAIARRALAALELRADDAVFCGDTGIDMKTARNAGCIPIGVSWGFRTRGELMENGARHVIDTPEELLDHLIR